MNGFALLALLIAITAASGVFVAGLPFLIRPQTDFAATAQARLERIRAAAQTALIENGSIPANLNALANATTVPADDRWRTDPFNFADFQYEVSGDPATLTVASVGLDRSAGTADDLSIELASEPDARTRTRNRLRTIRSKFNRSNYMYDAAMSPADRSSMLANALTYSTTQRAIDFAANTGDRANLIAQRDAARNAILNLRTTYSLPPPPNTVSGPGGLLSALGLPDSLDADGHGTPLIANDAVGCTSAGADRTGGTNDDL